MLLLKPFCYKLLFLMLVSFFISSSALPCSIGVSTPTKFDSTEYIFIGKIIGYVGHTSSEFLWSAC